MSCPPKVDWLLRLCGLQALCSSSMSSTIQSTSGVDDCVHVHVRTDARLRKLQTFALIIWKVNYCYVLVFTLLDSNWTTVVLCNMAINYAGTSYLTLCMQCRKISFTKYRLYSVQYEHKRRYGWWAVYICLFQILWGYVEEYWIDSVLLDLRP